jgi:hypothetical protein
LIFGKLEPAIPRGADIVFTFATLHHEFVAFRHISAGFTVMKRTLCLPVFLCMCLFMCLAPASNFTFAQTTTATAPSYAGFWNKPAEGGWGLNIQQQGEFVFAAWYTYAADGSPTWFTMSCRLAGDRCSDNFYAVTGKPLTSGLFGIGANAVVAGSGSLTFNSANNLTFSYNVLGKSKTINDVTRFNFVAADKIPVCTQTGDARRNLTNYTDMWWGGTAASGWGISLSHQGDLIFVAMYTYNNERKAVWSTGLATKVAGTFATYSGDFNTPQSGTPYYDINGSNATTFPAPKNGTFTLSFGSGDAATLIYDLKLSGGSESGAGGVALTRFAVASGATTYCQSPGVPPRTDTGYGADYPWPVWTPAIPAVPASTTGLTYYVDGTAGVDTNTGKTLTAAFKTIGKALSVLAAGDTILIRKGLYREPIDLNAKNVPSGTAAKPITIGSYGDGEVIVDGSAKSGTWTLVSGTVWKAPISFVPIAVVVNDVPLKQVTQGQGGSTAPQVGLAGVTSNSGKWHIGGGFVTADFGTALGSGNPNQADIVLPNSDGGQAHVYFYHQEYINFVGLTIRGSGSNGVWGYGSHITVERCNIKFNGKAAVSYLNDSDRSFQNTDNSVLYSNVYQNVMTNWPRGNNGYAESGGGWPGTLVWSGNLRPLARGNIVTQNGGEGIISYGTYQGKPSGSALFEQNVAIDNWSVNMYFDNQPNNVARSNLLFNHPVDYNPSTTNFLYVGNTYPYNSIGKYSVCIMLADEQISSDGTNGYANLDNTKVYNNIMAGCRISIRDYSEGSSTIANHGIKNTLIANNTIIMPSQTFTDSNVYGIYIQDNGNRNTNTQIVNNIIYGYNNDPLVFSEKSGGLGGITLNYNDYYSPSATPFGNGFNTVKYYSFAGWKADVVGADVNSKFANPTLTDANYFRTTGTGSVAVNNADISSTSPSRGAGLPLSSSLMPAVNFRLESRQTSTWNIGAF